MSVDGKSAAHGRRAVPLLWFGVSMLLIVVTTVVGMSVYGSLPQTVPTHWGGDGVPDRFSEKSVWSVFAQIMIAAGLAVFLLALSYLIRSMPVRGVPSGDPAWDERRLRVARDAGTALLGQLMFWIVAVVCWISIASWLLPARPWAVTFGVIVLLVAIAVVLFRFYLRWRRLIAQTPAGEASADEARHWKAGLFYVDPEDPKLMVPRRLGVGWTVNFGHPAGAAIGVALLVLLLGAVALVVLRSL
ncbi:DUF5808 domain-containing protein [Arthrobacter sp. NPDC090010]|uniref:DUF5808 domain-containing protein n=1 Tax=Arthrobacter sp. NPDC090010 TaxID=3363942 RepID=UPI0037F543AB